MLVIDREFQPRCRPDGQSCTCPNTTPTSPASAEGKPTAFSRNSIPWSMMYSRTTHNPNTLSWAAMPHSSKSTKPLDNRMTKRFCPSCTFSMNMISLDLLSSISTSMHQAGRSTKAAGAICSAFVGTKHPPRLGRAGIHSILAEGTRSGPPHCPRAARQHEEIPHRQHAGQMAQVTTTWITK